ncbi:spermine synthase [Ctenocephalides felis]|uniref:spermine synthase n=1 Tax=Ctenocephalides felis TaxID=7515 RepID=UPI000E6E1AE3|nr:spermine synthase [Ctenocephalides felis]
MSVHTIMMDFSIDPNRVLDSKGQKSVYDRIIEKLNEHFDKLTFLNEVKIDGGSLKLYSSVRGSVFYIRIYERGLITINLEYYKVENEEPLITFDSARDLKNKIYTFCSMSKCHAYPTVKRGDFCRYFPTSDERLMEYDIDEIVFDDHSQYQKVQIVHSKSLGNMLVLDELQNIAESDLIYTETLMQRGKENYENKEIVILGGGDGALLYELLKEKPKFVTMLEIDEMVMKACSKHLRSICGDVLDQMRGENYEIIVGDCLDTLKKFINENHKVDYIFGDLTDIPISKSTQSDLTWSFIKVIMKMSFEVLNPKGKFMTHGNGSANPESLKLFEEHLNAVRPAVNYTKTEAFVPSFLENWVFYQIQQKSQ